jgi:hypothetical protein
MIDFEIPADLVALRDKIRQFVIDEIVPYERDPRLTQHGPTDEMRQEMVAKARKAGLLSIQVPRELGGMGLDHIGHGLKAIEQLHPLREFLRGDARHVAGVKGDAGRLLPAGNLAVSFKHRAVQGEAGRVQRLHVRVQLAARLLQFQQGRLIFGLHMHVRRVERGNQLLNHFALVTLVAVQL